MNFKEFFLANCPEQRSLVEDDKVCLVRHVMKHRKDGEWEAFDKKLQFDEEFLRFFTGGQVKPKFDKYELIMVFVAPDKSQTLFRGAFTCRGRITAQTFRGQDGFAAYRKFRADQVASDPVGSEVYWYDLQSSDILKEYRNRLMIDWGPSAQQWVQKNLEKNVWQIMPPGFVSPFPGWDKVLIDYSELKAIVENRDGNSDWHSFLSRHDGVYLILDRKTGAQYVGAVWGEEGFWGRWSGYVKTGHNSNKGLVELLETETDRENLSFSLLWVCPKSATSKKAALEYESLLKRKLGSRVHGLNHN